MLSTRKDPPPRQAALELVPPRALDQPGQRPARAAAQADVARGHVGHPARQDRERRDLLERAGLEQLGERALHRAVAAVDHHEADLAGRELPENLAEPAVVADLAMHEVRGLRDGGAQLVQAAPVALAVGVADQAELDHTAVKRLAAGS